MFPTTASGIYPLGHLPWAFSFSGDPTPCLLILTRLGFSSVLLCLFSFPFSDVSKILWGLLSVSDELWGLRLFFRTLHLDGCVSGKSSLKGKFRQSPGYRFMNLHCFCINRWHSVGNEYFWLLHFFKKFKNKNQRDILIPPFYVYLQVVLEVTVSNASIPLDLAHLTIWQFLVKKKCGFEP